MPTVTFIEHDGTRHTVEADEQMSVMEAATLNIVPGVEGMCGGICSCATCHCYLDEKWMATVPEPSPGEMEMLGTASHRKPNSRLGCQLHLDASHEGMEVHLPPEQG